MTKVLLKNNSSYLATKKYMTKNTIQMDVREDVIVISLKEKYVKPYS